MSHKEPLLPKQSNGDALPSKTSLVSADSFGGVIRLRRISLIISAVLAVLSSTLGLVPYYVGYVVSLYHFETSASDPFLSSDLTILQLALVAVASTVLKGLCEGLSTGFSHHAAYNILYDLRVVLAQKLGRVPLGYCDGKTTGELKKIMHEDIEMLELALAHMIPDLVGGLSTPVLAGALLFSISWQLTLATIASGVIGLGLFTMMMVRFNMDEFYSLMDKMNGIVIQYLNGMKVVKAFTRTDSSFQQFSDVVQEIKDVYVEISAMLAGPYAVMLVMMRSAAVTIVPAALFLYSCGDVDIPTTMLFILIGIGFNQPLHAAMMHGGQSFHLVYTASKRIKSVMDVKELQDPAVPKAPSGRSVSFSDVKFGYKEGQRALDGVTFRAEEGQVTALVGPSGSGKSTIAKLASRFWDIDSGSIRIGDTDVTDIQTTSLMDLISLVFQDVFLFDDTIANNIAIGRPGASRQEIAQAAKLAQCEEFIVETPNGYDTVIGENGLKLSGGQRQRLSIARAVLKGAPIIILDEATAFLDPENEVLVQNALSGLLKKGKTILVVAHRLSTIAGAGEIVVVDKGQIHAKGKHEDLLRSCELYSAQWEAHRNARAWQIQGQNRSKPQLVGNLFEKEVPLKNLYEGLNKADGVVSQVRAFVPPEDDHLFVNTAIFRTVESLAIAFSSFVVYFVVTILFDSSSSGKLASTSAYGAVAALLASCLFQIWIGYCANLTGHKLMISVQCRLRTYLADYLRRLPMGFFTSYDAGTIDTLFTTCIMFLEPHQILDSMVHAVVTPASILVLFIVLDWRLALVLCSSVLLSTIGLWWASLIFKRHFGKRTAAATEANHRMVEYIQGISVIRAFNMTGTSLTTFATAIEQYRDRTLALIYEIIPAVIVFKSTLEIGYGVFILVGSYFVDQGSLDVKSFLVFLVMGHAFFNPIKEVAAFGELYKIMESSAKKIGAFLESPLLSHSQRPSVPQDTSIEFDNVSFCYENEEYALKNVSFRIEEGSTVALVGASGSGKTTCANLLARFWDTTGGCIRLGGADVKDITSNVLLSQLTTVFQDVYLFKDTIHNNILFGNPKATEDEVMAAAKAAQCDEFVSQLPDRYQTTVGEGGATLSGGEKQRVSIARALLKDAPIVVLDEATASLDPENERQIQLAIQALGEQKTLIVIAHRLATIANADKILVFDNGKLREEGCHGDLMERSDGLYRKLWEARLTSHEWKIA